MESLAQIQNLVSEFLSGSIEFKDLADRFEPLLAAAVASSEVDAVRVGEQIELRIARFIDGYVSESSLRVQLDGLITPKPFMIAPLTIQLCVPASEENMRVPFSASGAFSPSFGQAGAANPFEELIAT